jgi:hypothetical protein
MSIKKRKYLEFQAELRKDIIQLGKEIPEDEPLTFEARKLPEGSTIIIENDNNDITGSRYKPFKYLCQQWVWLSIKKASKCFFSRRNGYQGKVIFGYSIRLRLFKMEVI